MEHTHHKKEGEEYDQHGRPVKVPNVATDAIVLRPHKDNEGSHDILLITRAKDPF